MKLFPPRGLLPLPGAISISLFLSLCLAPAAHPQDIRHNVGVVNIEIPVRVFDGGAFVDDLTLGDFEVTEDGVPQQVQAVYLIRKAALARKEETKTFAPPTSRTFLLVFELHEYLPKVREALDYFLSDILMPGDSLVVGTPRKTYRMKPDVLSTTPRDKILDRLNGLVRKDILTASQEYRRALNDLKELVAQGQSMSSGPMDYDLGSCSLEETLSEYRMRLQRLESLRSLDEKKFLEFSRALKSATGQKIVFLFYQREFLPTIDKDTYFATVGTNEHLDGLMAELFSLNKREPTLSPEVIRNALADASITVNFLYLTSRTDDIPVQQMTEHSEDVFRPFLEMAKTTGGVASSSTNPAAMMATASAAAENYYLVYYSPRDYKPDGKFREIEVRVKKGACRVTHRAGYFAD